MNDTTKIRERMDVICSCGTKLGTVDHLDDERIKLTKSDPSAGGRHHWVPMDWVESVDDKVHLSLNSEEAMADWEEEGDEQGVAGQSRGGMSQQGGRASQSDSKTSPQPDGAPAKGGASRGRKANAGQEPSDTQPRI